MNNPRDFNPAFWLICGEDCGNRAVWKTRGRDTLAYCEKHKTRHTDARRQIFGGLVRVIEGANNGE